jgi:hypothetical protein
MTKLTCEKIREFIKDEEKGIKDYKDTGLNKLAKDEAGHKQFLEKLAKQRCK